MDCDYDPDQASSICVLNNDNNLDGRRKRKKRKNKLAEALAKEKPIFDPSKTDKTFAQYLDEYYKLDCEDVIGDMPCRFKYREVPPLDYGLTTAEILMADDQELNRWYPLKKTLQYRPEHKQINDQKVLENKAKNIKLKMKILPSLFKKVAKEEPDDTTVINTNNEENTTKKRKSRKKNKNKQSPSTSDAFLKDNVNYTTDKSNKKQKSTMENVNLTDKPDESEVPKKKPRKRKKNMDCLEITDIKVGQSNGIENECKELDASKDSIGSPFRKKRKHIDNGNNSSELHNENGDITKKKKKNKGIGKKSKNHIAHDSNDPMSNLSDERLKAYGLNPKKYKNFMKFKKY